MSCLEALDPPSGCFSIVLLVTAVALPDFPDASLFPGRPIRVWWSALWAPTVSRWGVKKPNLVVKPFFRGAKLTSYPVEPVPWGSDIFNDPPFCGEFTISNAVGWTVLNRDESTHLKALLSIR